MYSILQYCVNLNFLGLYGRTLTKRFLKLQLNLSISA